MTTDLTCLSCAHYRPSGCARRFIGWPTAALHTCPGGDYLPGSDEREDDDA